MIAAAGAAMAAVDHELVGPEPRRCAILVDAAGDRDRFAPCGGRMDIHFDHARVGRDLDDAHAADLAAARSLRHGPAFELRRGRLDDGEQFEIIGEHFDRRHEHTQPSVARLDGERGAHRQAAAPGGTGSR